MKLLLFAARGAFDVITPSVFVAASAALLLALPALGAPPAERTYSYDKPVSVSGSILTNQPGLDANEKPEPYTALRVRAPGLQIVGEDPATHTPAPPRPVEVLQLVGASDETRAAIAALIPNQRVTVKGQLFASISAHHHTPVLISVSAVELMKDGLALELETPSYDIRILDGCPKGYAATPSATHRL